MRIIIVILAVQLKDGDVMSMPNSQFRSRRLPICCMPIAAVGCLALSTVSYGAGEGQRDIEEIVVTSRYTTNDRLDTATGLGLTLHETPQSVSLMTEQRIADQNLHSLTEVVHNAPGVSAKAQDSSRHTFSARGFAINNYQLDGVPIYWQPGGNAGETQSDMSLYQRVEVVRGATGLLTGAGNPSGSINLVRKHADSEVLAGTVDVSAGRWDSYAVTADVSSPLNASGSVRGRFLANHQDGESFRELAGDSTTVFYGTMDVDLSSQTLLRFGASRQDNEPTASTWGGLPVWYADGSRTDWDRDKTIAAEWTSWSSRVENYYVDLIQEFGDGWSAKLSYNNSLNASDQKLLYLGYDNSPGAWLSPSPRHAETESEQNSLSFHLNGRYQLMRRAHELTFGVVDHEEDTIARAHSMDPATVAPVGNFDLWDGSYPQPVWGAASVSNAASTKQFGIYGATRLSLSEQFKLIVGARVADWEQRGFSWQGFHDYGNDNVVIPYAGALYDITDQHTVYASYTEIFRPQNNRKRNGDFLDPVAGSNRELGLKSRFFDDLLHTSISVFSILEDNLAQVDGDPVTIGGELVQFYRGAEGAESEGYEVELVGKVTEGLDLSFSYTHFDAEDADGQPVNTNHPRELLKLYSTYRFDGALADLTVAGGINWQGRNYTQVTNPFTGSPERLEQDAYSLVSLMARYDFTPNLSGQLNIDNALDEEYFSQIGFYSQLEYGQPRNITASFKYSF